MHTVKKVSDTQWEVGYYRPPIQGDPHNVWTRLVVFKYARQAAAAVSALNGGGTADSFTEQMWEQLELTLGVASDPLPAAKPA